MSTFARWIGLASLVGTVIPPFLFMIKSLEHNTMQTIMLISCLSWFAAAPWWMKSE